MRKAVVDGRTGITCGQRSDGSVAVLFDDGDEIVWLFPTSWDVLVTSIQGE